MRTDEIVSLAEGVFKLTAVLALPEHRRTISFEMDAWREWERAFPHLVVHARIVRDALIRHVEATEL